MVNGRSVLNPPAYQYLGDRDSQVSGRNNWVLLN
jgi:hypothetical protein